MTKILSKLGLGRICLMSIILLCSVFTSENAFSRPWQQKNMAVNYDKKDGTITFEFLFYDLLPGKPNVHSYLDILDIQYIEGGSKYTDLIKIRTIQQSGYDVAWIKMSFLKPTEKFEFPNSRESKDDISYYVGNKMMNATYQDGNNSYSSRNAYMTIKWTLPKSIKNIKNVKYTGSWTVSEKSGISHRIEDVIPLKIDRSNSNELKKAHSVLKSEISDNVKVSGETDAINVNGAATGEQIKVYTVSGVEVKSVVANDDVVNIKLPTNQI